MDSEVTTRWHLLALPTCIDGRGGVTFMEAGLHVPFPIERVYFLHGVPPSQRRVGHAHRALQQVLIAATGSFDVTCDDGRVRHRYRLDDPETGLHLAAGVWVELERFDPGSVCLVLASAPYDPDDYWWDYDDFRACVAPE